MPKERKLSLGTFGCAVLFFFLPFVQLSCMGERVVQLSGAQLAVGTSIEHRNAFGGTQSRKIDASPVAFFAFASAITGLALSLSSSGLASRVRTGAALAGIALLLALRAQVAGASAREGQGLITVDFEAGYYLSLLLLATAAAIHLYFLAKRSGEVSSRKALDAGGHCARCAKPLNSEARFCLHCGAPSAPAIPQDRMSAPRQDVG